MAVLVVVMEDCMTGNRWSEGMKRISKAGREETTQKGREGDSKYNEYNQHHKSVHTVRAFFLYVSLRVGWVHEYRETLFR